MDKQQDTSSNMPVPLLDVTEPLRHLPHIVPCRRPRSRDAIGRQPAGTGSAQIRWSIAPNSRRVRWLSASRSQ